MLLCVRCLALRRPPHARHLATGLKVLVFGSSDFGLNTLQSLHETSQQKAFIDHVHLITGKKTPMKVLADKNGIEMLPYPPDLKRGQYDVGVVVSFGHLIPGRVIEKFPCGVLNIHPSILPRWRGAAPISHTVLAGDKMTGVSIMEIRPKRFDVGPILMQETVPVPEGITTKTLSGQMSQIGAGMLLKALENLDSIHSGQKPQTDDSATYAHKLTTDMTYVNWKEQTCVDIDRQYRGLHEQIPLRSKYLDNVTQLLDMVRLESASDSNESSPPGTAKYRKDLDLVQIKCKDGWLGFRKFVYKKPMSASSFHNGYLSKDYNRGLVFQSIENTVLKYIHLARIPS